MTSWKEFHDQLVSHQAWWESIMMRHGKKDLIGLSKDCYAWLLTQPTRWKAQDYNDFRRGYQKFLIYAPDMTEPQAAKYEPIKPVEEHPQALTGEARDKKIKEFLEVLSKVGQPARIYSTTHISHIAQQLEKPKGVVYHSQSKEEVYKKDRHIAYLQQAFHHVTREPLTDGIIDEEEYNRLYDAGLV